MKTTICGCILVALIAFYAWGCDSDSGSGADGEAGGDQNPTASLRAQVSSSNPLACEGERCCLYRCSDGKILCVTRALADLKQLDPYASCDQVFFPDWFYTNDCYLFDLETAGIPDSVITQCFCGKTDSGFSGEYSFWVDITACDNRAVPAPDEIANLQSLCASSAADCSGGDADVDADADPDGCGECGTFGSFGECCGGIYCSGDCIGSPCC